MTKQSPSEYVHPETGEVLATEDEWRAALAAVEERLVPIYRLRRQLLTERAVRFEAPELPPRRSRTDTQERIARCPRCGERLESEEAPR
jgi:hypothetical protein